MSEARIFFICCSPNLTNNDRHVVNKNSVKPRYSPLADLGGRFARSSITQRRTFVIRKWSGVFSGRQFPFNSDTIGIYAFVFPKFVVFSRNTLKSPAAGQFVPDSQPIQAQSRKKKTTQRPLLNQVTARDRRAGRRKRCRARSTRIEISTCNPPPTATCAPIC